MYYPDGSKYSFLSRTRCSERSVINIGWLSKEHSYPTGESESLAANLKEILLSHTQNQTRGYHQCPFCTEKTPSFSIADVTVSLGSAEIWIDNPRSEVIYAAPDLIIHYVSEHGYLPPEEFCEAVRAAVENIPAPSRARKRG